MPIERKQTRTIAFTTERTITEEWEAEIEIGTDGGALRDNLRDAIAEDRCKLMVDDVSVRRIVEIEGRTV